MQLGFIGTGEITSSIVTSLSLFGEKQHFIRLSPRNPVIARELADRFKGISIASSNQEVLDHSDTIVIAVRPPVARTIVSEMCFRPDSTHSRCGACLNSWRLQQELLELCHCHQRLSD